MRRVIVDGYNVLHAWAGPRAAMREGRLEDARGLLVRALAEYSARSDVEVTVVFDSHGRSGGQQVEVVDGVTVRFASRRASADHVIERLAYEEARRGEPIDLMIATSDRLTRDVVGAMGVPTMSALAFEAEVGRVVTEAKHANHRVRRERARRLEDHLATDVREKLDAIRRGAPGGATETMLPKDG